MRTITYSDLFIPELDQNYIDKLIDERDVDCSELDISYVFESENFNSAKLTNAIIWEIFYRIIMHNVTNIDDQNKLIDSIYTNAFCSWLDISADDVETEEAKDLVRNFNW
mgnify:FL=1